MSLTYLAALEKLERTAHEQRSCRVEPLEWVSMRDAVGRIAACDFVSPKSTPEFDTSAMDGYAIWSHATAFASVDRPAIFKIQGTMAAGDQPIQGIKLEEDGVKPCIEIMTGAIFPYAASEEPLDTCVKIEDTSLLSLGKQDKYIAITKPIPPHANKRLAGEDIQIGDIIVKEGETVQSRHLIPLSAVGFEYLSVIRKPSVGIFSTGKELLNGRGATRDVNGPYLTAALREMNVETEFFGALDDDPISFERHLRDKVESARYDVIITSGAVSVGKFDFIRTILDKMGAEIVFHGVALRPGHPVLFALLIAANRNNIAFFGLPGNPCAAAACFRFLALPYLRWIQGQEPERSISAKLQSPKTKDEKHKSLSTGTFDRFYHGIMQTTIDGKLLAEASQNQSPAKLAQFINANCWIHFQRGREYHEADVVQCYPISPAASQWASAS